MKKTTKSPYHERLSDEQRMFLDEKGISISRVFDATGMRKAEYREAMHNLELWVAFGVTECKKAGHALRTRSGHCVQCSPENISYLRRHDEGGAIYVAWSKDGGLSKVGTSKDPSNRIPHLRSYEYGGESDWRLIFTARCERAGRVEALAHQTLASVSVTGEYFKEGRYIACRELFQCDGESAVEAVMAAVAALE